MCVCVWPPTWMCVCVPPRVAGQKQVCRAGQVTPGTCTAAQLTINFVVHMYVCCL